jgi:hypothetical protein
VVQQESDDQLASIAAKAVKTSRAASFARFRAGKSMAARIAMMAMTTNSSMSVNLIEPAFAHWRQGGLRRLVTTPSEK